MDGLARATGGLYRTLTVGETKYKLATPRLGDLAALEAAIVVKLPDPVEQAAKSAHLVPAEQQERFWDAAFSAAARSRAFKVEDLDELPQSLQVAASAFVVLQRHHGTDIDSLDKAAEWAAAAFDEHGPVVAGILQGLSMEDPAKNGPEAEAASP